MIIIKSFSATDINGESGDMFYINHGSSNFTIIDCCLNEENKKRIVDEILDCKKQKEITRFISTHPDEDHICGLDFLDEKISILNFYCVENKATKKDESDSFKHYCKLRDDNNKHYFVFKGCKRKWMNDNDENDGKNIGSSGIDFLWPIVSNKEYTNELKKAEKGISFNNISPIFTYSLENGVKVMWMGDMEHEFLEKIKKEISWPQIDILFAPHHGRKSGKVSEDVLKELNPKIVVIGEAPSEHIDYYNGYNTLTQNTAGDIVFKCDRNIVHIYVSNSDYSVEYLNYQRMEDRSLGFYIGSFEIEE